MNLKQVVPLLLVSDMERSLRYYVDGLGFTIGKKWIVDGKLRWCWRPTDLPEDTKFSEIRQS